MNKHIHCIVRFCSKRLQRVRWNVCNLASMELGKQNMTTPVFLCMFAMKMTKERIDPAFYPIFFHPFACIRIWKEKVDDESDRSVKKKKVKVSSEREWPINNLALHFYWPPLLELEFLEFCNFNFFSKKAIYQRRHLWNLGNCKNMFQNTQCIHKDYYEYVEFVDNEECCKQQWWEQQQKE